MTGTGEAVMFWIVAPIMVIAALGLIFAKRAVYAALCMVLTMILLGVLYLGHRADFLGLVQVFVYTGAVMMLFLFVIMIVGVESSETVTDTLRGQRWIGLVLGLGLAIMLVGPLLSVTVPMIEPAGAAGGVSALAFELFSTYLLAFELIGVVLAVAGVAALVLAHRERLFPRLTQKRLAQNRVRQNRHVAGLPAPGVYARSTRADVPALLPDGSPAENSVSRVLQAREQVVAPDALVEAAHESGRELEEGQQR